MKTISNPALNLQEGQIGSVEGCSPLSKQQISVKNYKMGIKNDSQSSVLREVFSWMSYSHSQ